MSVEWTDAYVTEPAADRDEEMGSLLIQNDIDGGGGGGVFLKEIQIHIEMRNISIYVCFLLLLSEKKKQKLSAYEFPVIRIANKKKIVRANSEYTT